MNIPPEILGIIYDYSQLIINNTVMELYEKYIDRVNWNSLSSNPNIPLSFFEKYLYKVNWDLLSGNLSILVSFFEKNLVGVNWDLLSGNLSIPVSFFKNHLNKVDGFIYHLILIFRYLSLKNILIK